MPTWLQQLQRNFKPGAEPEQGSPLWLEMYNVAQQCCAGNVPPQEWLDLYFQQYWHLRSAYKSLRSLEKELVEGHPALSCSQALRQLLLGLRGTLNECRRLLPDRNWDRVEAELVSLRTGLQALERQADQLQSALESLRCLSCQGWAPASDARCPGCGGELELEDESFELDEDQSAMPEEYARLRDLADRVRSEPEQGEALRQHALHLVQQLKDTEGPTRDLRLEDPDTPVEEMLQELQKAREGLMEMAQWPMHRSTRRLERGWDRLIQHLGRFEEMLEEFEEAEG